MKQRALRKICNSLPGATETIQWGEDRVFKVGGKMFACSGIERDSKYSFKVDADRFLELTDRAGVIPAPYLARAKWIQIDPTVCELPDTEIESLVRESYAMVFGKLSKRLQAELAQGESGK